MRLGLSTPKGTQVLMNDGLVVLVSGYIEEACNIPCPSDCKLSEWSNWSRCSKSCGSGVKVRSKWLREKRYNGGRPCPKLDQTNQVGGSELHVRLACIKQMFKNETKNKVFLQFQG